MRKIFLYGILCVLCSWYTGSSVAQNATYPNTLLWRISGKGLSKPSYLYGTMHLKDRRLFNFSDSLYRSLEQVEGYAMEIDPDEAMSALFKTLNDPDTTQYIYADVDQKEFGKVAKGLEKKFGVPAQKITRRQVWLYKQGLGAQAESEDDMDSAMDTYLFNIARRQGKWVGGIEDLEDQLNLIDELGNSFDINDLNDLLERKASQKGAVEALIRIYLAQNLNKINEWTLQVDSVEKLRMLTVRNKKMARRMDSLAHIRSSFFAVGAAHLPGTDGVIDLLRAQGYTVEPVVGSRKISPEKYSYKEVALPWFEVSNDEKSFAIRMPGKPTPLIPNGEAFKMHIYADLGTGLAYYAANVIIAEGSSKDDMLFQFAKNYTKAGKHAKPMPVRFKGMDGYETVSSSEGYYYRLRMFKKGDQIVMAMVGSQKKSLLYAGEAEKFYQSLEVSEYQAPKEAAGSWHTHLDREKRVAVDFPGKTSPNKDMERQISERLNSEQWDIYNQTYMDLVNQTYYMFIFKEPKPGNYLQDDAMVFEEGKANILNNTALELVRFDTGRLNGLAAAWMDADYKENNLFVKSLHVNRGNRGVSLMAVYDKNSGDTAGVNKFLNSLRFLDLEATEFKEVADPGGMYTVKAPGPLQPYKSDEDADTVVTTVTSYDSGSGFSFIIQKSAISPYYWAKDDSTFFADMVPGYLSYGDSLLASRKISNGVAPGMEYEIRMLSSGRNTKRVRIFLQQDTAYSLSLIAPPAYQRIGNFDHFFSSFRFNKYESNKNLAINKASQLLSDLHSGDSLTFETAKAYISQAPFTVKDLPALHKALLSTYRDSGTYNSVQEKIMNRVIDLKDASSIGFIQEAYRSKNLNEELRYPLLRVLASIPTTDSYTTLKELLKERYPQKGEPAGLAYRILDSLPLAKSLYPEFLSFTKDSVLSDVVVDVTEKLLDSNMIQLAVVLPYKEQIQAQARYWYKRWSAEEDNQWQFYNWVKLLGRFNDESGNELLQQVAGGNDIYIQKLAVVELIKNGQAVKPSILEKIAADDYNRSLFYDDLKKLNCLKLFPAKYLNQKSIARSELVQYMSEDDMEPSEITFLSEKEAIFQGKKQKFYLFKLNYVYEDEKEVYLGICGPYAPGQKEIKTNPSVITLSDEQLGSRNLDELFEKTLKVQEEYLSEK